MIKMKNKTRPPTPNWVHLPNKVSFLEKIRLEWDKSNDHNKVCLAFTSSCLLKVFALSVFLYKHPRVHPVRYISSQWQCYTRSWLIEDTHFFQLAVSFLIEMLMVSMFFSLHQKQTMIKLRRCFISLEVFFLCWRSLMSLIFLSVLLRGNETPSRCCLTWHVRLAVKVVVNILHNLFISIFSSLWWTLTIVYEREKGSLLGHYHHYQFNLFNDHVFADMYTITLLSMSKWVFVKTELFLKWIPSHHHLQNNHKMNWSKWVLQLHQLDVVHLYVFHLPSPSDESSSPLTCFIFFISLFYSTYVLINCSRYFFSTVYAKFWEKGSYHWWVVWNLSE